MHFVLSFVLALSTLVTAPVPPKPIGRLIDLGGHRLHVNCTGKGSPTVVVENGLGDFSFDWVLVQRTVERATRICTYDRGGYAWALTGFGGAPPRCWLSQWPASAVCSRRVRRRLLAAKDRLI